MTSRAATEEEKSAAMETLFEISDLLDTGLDKENVTILKQMCDQGINPQALAQVIKYLRKESAATSNKSPSEQT